MTGTSAMLQRESGNFGACKPSSRICVRSARSLRARRSAGFSPRSVLRRAPITSGNHRAAIFQERTVREIVAGVDDHPNERWSAPGRNFNFRYHPMDQSPPVDDERERTTGGIQTFSDWRSVQTCNQSSDSPQTGKPPPDKAARSERRKTDAIRPGTCHCGRDRKRTHQ